MERPPKKSAFWGAAEDHRAASFNFLIEAIRGNITPQSPGNQMEWLARYEQIQALELTIGCRVLNALSTALEINHGLNLKIVDAVIEAVNQAASGDV